MNNFLLFAVSSFILNITPGSDMLYVATRSTSQGIKAGVISSLGIMAGCTVHILAAVIGLSAIIASSITVFTIIKYAGAGYLLYLAYKSFFGKSDSFEIKNKYDRIPLTKIFWQGAITNILNPKVALFFLAFLPQFISPHHSQPEILILLFGIWFNISGTLVNIAVAILFGKMGNWLANKTWFLKTQNKVTGLMLFLLGLKIALIRKS